MREPRTASAPLASSEFTRPHTTLMPHPSAAANCWRVSVVSTRWNAASTNLWLTSDSIVGLIGLIVAVGGLAVNIAFRWLDRRDRRAREDARDAREVELHALRVREIETRLAASGAATAGDSHE